ncbi:hypothetical protein ACFV16_30715 [Streptomyces massasporeus]|uniref:hypothetical protein n=1 Tax=Streptomyces massasporeus TaxID=67324 RepID=UPI00368AB6B7
MGVAMPQRFKTNVYAYVSYTWVMPHPGFSDVLITAPDPNWTPLSEMDLHLRLYRLAPIGVEPQLEARPSDGADPPG